MERGVVYLEHIEASRRLLFWAAVKRLLFRYLHRLTKKRVSLRDVLHHLLIWLLWFAPFLMNAAIRISLKERIGATLLGIYLIANGVKAWRDHAPVLWLRARENFATRQLYFGALMKQLIPKKTDEASVHGFQVDCL